MKRGVEFIAEERLRQVAVENWTQAHDDHHDGGELVALAMCYLTDPEARIEEFGEDPPIWFPEDWDTKSWRPTPDDRIRELTKAGALIAAEIDRLQRINLWKNND